MKHVIRAIFILFFVLAGLSLVIAADQDKKGSKDHPLLTRMPNFFISDYKDTEFDSHKFIGDDKTPTVIEAVTEVLIGTFGISPARLKSYGVASLVPITSNDTEEEKAKNRRVELVRQ